MQYQQKFLTPLIYRQQAEHCAIQRMAKTQQQFAVLPGISDADSQTVTVDLPSETLRRLRARVGNLDGCDDAVRRFLPSA